MGDELEKELTTEEKIDFIYGVAKALDETLKGLAPFLGLIAPMVASSMQTPNGTDPLNLMKMLG